MAMVFVNKLKLSGNLVRLARLSSTTAPGGGAKAPTKAPPKAPTPAAPAKPAAGEKASSASEPATDPSKYNSNDYYAHNTFSYYDIDAAVHKFRIPQPSKFDPLQPKK